MEVRKAFSDYLRKPILIIDVDETMIYAVEVKDGSFPFKNYDFEVNLEMRGGQETRQFKGKLRPHLSELLKFAGSRFEVWVYSNGTMDYVKSILKQIDPQNVCFDSKRVVCRDGKDFNKKLPK
jgi:TFIIF-interacting CTD phosphatase-like protein